MLSSEVAQLLKSYGYFSDLGVEITLSHRHVEFSGKANTSIYGFGVDDTADRHYAYATDLVVLYKYLNNLLVPRIY